MVWDAVELFPQASVAVHVLVILYDPAQAPFVVTSFEVNVNALPQPSVTTGTVNDGVAGQFMVVGAGNAEITGAMTSRTSIVCDEVEEFPQPSVAVHVLVAKYDPAHAPGVITSVGTNVNALPQPSVADAC